MGEPAESPEEAGGPDEASDLPVLPDAPSPPRPPPPIAPPPPIDEPGDTTLADELATRNVPTVRPRPAYALPTPPATPPVEEEGAEFVRPELLAMGAPTTALLVGRGLMVVAALLVGLAARRSVGDGDAGDAFWPVAASAGVFVAVGVAGLVFWSVALAENGRRLTARGPSPARAGWVWVLPVGWVLVSAVSYLRLEVGGQLDPLPGVAGIGFALALAIAYGHVRGVFRGLSRRPPSLWLTAFPLDLAAFGLVWWRLTSWPDPVTRGDADHVRLTADIAFGAAGALALNALVFGWLAQRGVQAVYERLGRLEARHRTDAGQVPQWYAGGVRVPSSPSVDRRPLIDVRALTMLVAGLHLLWALAIIALAGVLIGVAFEYSGQATAVDGSLVVDDADADLIGAAAVTAAVVYVLAIVVHGVWSVITALNARRVTIHAASPASFVALFVPMPIMVVVGLLIGGRVGDVVVLVGLAIAFFALLRLNQMLMSLSGDLGGQLRGFGTWTGLIGLAYLIGVAERFLFGQALGRLGFLGAAVLTQGVLIAIGAGVGYRAMAGLDDTLRDRHRARRPESD